MQELAAKNKELARLRATLSTSAKTAKALQADVAKKQAEHAALSEELEQLLASVDGEGGRQEALQAAVAEAEAALEAAAQEFGALHEQVWSCGCSVWHSVP